MTGLVGVALLALIVTACAEKKASAPVYEIATAATRSIEVTVGSSGIVEPLATVEVKSKASGEVLDLLVETGDHVEAGALLVRIDPRIVRNELDQSEAELKAARSRRAIAETQMKRAESLMRQGTFTEADHEQAVLALANAEAQVVAAQVKVENARIAVDDTDIRAPVSGTIIEKPVEKGQVISSPTRDVGGGTLLLKMADLSAVQIRALVDETDIGKIRPGMSASVTVAAYPNQPFDGKVAKVEPQAIVEQNVTMFAVLIAIQNPDGLLLPGMNAEVEVSIAQAVDVLTIPVMALRTNRDIPSTAAMLGLDETALRQSIRPREDDSKATTASTDYRFGGNFWVVVSNEGRYQPVPVRTGLTDLDRVEVVDGLEPGQQVIILPSAHLIETQEQLQQFINRRVGGVPGISNRQ